MIPLNSKYCSHLYIHQWGSSPLNLGNDKFELCLVGYCSLCDGLVGYCRLCGGLVLRCFALCIRVDGLWAGWLVLL